jgi:hypothetical protein
MDANPISTATDQEYMSVLGPSRTYMAGISVRHPFFLSNLFHFRFHLFFVRVIAEIAALPSFPNFR